MEGGTKTIVIVVLIVLILVGLTLVVRSMRGGSLSGQPKPPQYVLDRRMERIDKDSFEVEELSLGEWMKRGEKEGKYKNKAGKYTMVPVLVCASCGVKIPMPDLPMGPDMDPIKHDEMMMNYKCPKCGKLAMNEFGAMGPMPAGRGAQPPTRAPAPVPPGGPAR